MTKVLSLDGGGVFGIAQALIISQSTNLSKYSAIAGTSIGAVMASAIASGDTKLQQALPSFFIERMPDIFGGYWWRHYSPITPRYSDKALCKELQAMFPTQYFKDLKVPTFITAVDLNARRLKVFNSKDPQDGTIPLWEVLRMATAAESYFAPYQGKGDGGISVNNPSMVAVAAVQSVLGVPSESVELLSIGTGESNYTDSIGSQGYRTLLGWGTYILDSALSGASSRMHEYFVQQMGLAKYARIQFMRDPSWNMDSPDDMLTAAEKWKPAIDAGIITANNF